MRVSPTSLGEVLHIEPNVHRDSRGFLVETYHQRRYEDSGLEEIFVQDNLSSSSQGTLRGLHAQSRRPQGKLVWAIEGEIFDVAVDIRVGSPTFRHWVGRTLSQANLHQLYIPPGFAHGFCVLSERAAVVYKCTQLYDSDDQIVVAWNDPEIGIEWPIEEPMLSDRDRQAPLLSEIAHRLPVYRGARERRP